METYLHKLYISHFRTEGVNNVNFALTVAEFATQVIAPLAHIVDTTGSIPGEIIQKGADIGLFGLPFPKEYGGGGVGYIGLVLAIEEIARVCASTALAIASHTSLAAEAVSQREQNFYYQCRHRRSNSR